MLEQNNLVNVGESIIQGIVDKCRQTMKLMANLGAKSADAASLSKIVQ